MLHVHILVLRRRTSMFGNRSIELFNCTNDDSAFGQDEDAHYQLQHLMQQYKDVKKKLKKSNAYISQIETSHQAVQSKLLRELDEARSRNEGLAFANISSNQGMHSNLVN